MKVLLLHPEDNLPRNRSREWDLVVDFGRAPDSTYDRWAEQAGCRIIGLFEFAEEIRDLHRCRELLQLGMGRLIDRQGIDWWDVVSLEIVPDLQQLMLVDRLAKFIATPCELYASRPFGLARVLGNLLGAEFENLASGLESVHQRMRHYAGALSRLNAAQLAQIIQDKFDPVHSIRRRLSRRRPSLNRPVILLPSAYVNVSRAAVSYAALLPDHEFLLVCARQNGHLESLPANVHVASLDSYFRPVDEHNLASLLAKWRGLKREVTGAAAEFKAAGAAGVLNRIPSRLRWTLSISTAWSSVFESEDITGCLCADDTNPYTRIPLILAKRKGITALACHHGALDSWMALKTLHADFYLAKCEMERDYLQRVCRVEPERIALGNAAPSKQSRLAVRRFEAPWLVFFTEPYQNAHWRNREVYRELLPRLWDLAQTCGLKLVFKLHPFESAKGHRRMLRRYLPEQEHRIEIIARPPSAELWEKTRFAVTVQSSTVLECAALGIPVFLCGWLRDSYSGYVRQYARFDIGHVLESPEQIGEISRLLKMYNEKDSRRGTPWQTIDPGELAHLISGTHSLPVASNA